MKQLNLYYVISIITLVLMMIILISTLEVSGWFEDHGEPKPAAKFKWMLVGNFTVEADGIDSTGNSKLIEIKEIEAVVPQWLEVTLDSSVILRFKTSDFEDEQVLVELFQADSGGEFQRLEGCELLLVEDPPGVFTGSTLGDFCGLSQQSGQYYWLRLSASRAETLVEIETREEDQHLIKSVAYKMIRQDHDE